MMVTQEVAREQAGQTFESTPPPLDLARKIVDKVVSDDLLYIVNKISPVIWLGILILWLIGALKKEILGY